MQLKTSKQLMIIRQCLVRMGVPAHDDKRLWKVVVGPTGPIITRERIQECSLTKNNIPARVTLRGKSTLIEQGRSTAQGGSS